MMRMKQRNTSKKSDLREDCNRYIQKSPHCDQDDLHNGTQCAAQSPPICRLIDQIAKLVWRQLQPQLPASAVAVNARMVSSDVQISETSRPGHIIDVHEDTYIEKDLNLRVWVPLEPLMRCRPFVLSAISHLETETKGPTNVEWWSAQGMRRGSFLTFIASERLCPQHGSHWQPTKEQSLVQTPLDVNAKVEWLDDDPGFCPSEGDARARLRLVVGLSALGQP